jgi:uncharacterized damage-inducible protein DinB
MPGIKKSIFEYKAWANNEIFSLLITIDSSIFPEVVHSAIRVLNHAFVVDEIFRSHLLQRSNDHTATNTDATPSALWLFEKVKELDAWYISYASTVEDKALSESIEFTFTDGDRGKMTREEILLHVITHGGYHRGQAGQIIGAANVLPPRDIYTRFLHLTEPSRIEENT